MWSWSRKLISKKSLFPGRNITIFRFNQNETQCLVSDNSKHVNNEVFRNCNEDISSVVPDLQNTFNVAAYVAKSDTLRKLIELNVNLSKIEKRPHILKKLLMLEFGKDITQHLFFLNDYVAGDDIGVFLTKNPMIFFESLDDLHVRINYLQSKQFKKSDIKNIISRNPFWLMYSTLRIDRRLGFFQEHFCLNGAEVRTLASTNSKIITHNIQHIKTSSFMIKEEMGFEHNELKSLLLSKPKIWMMNQKSLLERFNYLHNIMNISHKTIIRYPQVLECRKFKVMQRHLFLQKLGRAQYDPKKENFVPIMALVEGSDIDFCIQYAKCNVDDFNIFLKTL